jgi:hypothetical protein
MPKNCSLCPCLYFTKFDTILRCGLPCLSATRAFRSISALIRLLRRSPLMTYDINYKSEHSESGHTQASSHSWLFVSLDIISLFSRSTNSCSEDLRIHPAYIIDPANIANMTSQATTLPLQGKVAIVTGASRGIGAGLALELASRGAKVGAQPPSALPNRSYA